MLQRRPLLDARTRPPTAALTAACVVAIAVSSSPAHAMGSREAAESSAVVEPSAEDIERARELYDNGVGLYEEGSYQSAALAFQRAYELSEDSNLLYNIALAYDRLGEFEQAIEYLDRYRAFAPQSERAELERRKQSLRTRLEKQREAEATGEPEPEPEPEPDEELDDAVIPAPASDAPPPPKPERRVPPAAWALGATAVVGLGAGIGFGVMSLQSTRAGRDGCTEAGDSLLCQGTVGPDLRRGRTFALVSDISFAVAGAAAVGAIVVVALHARRRKADQLAVVPHAGPGGAGAMLVRRF